MPAPSSGLILGLYYLAHLGLDAATGLALINERSEEAMAHVRSSVQIYLTLFCLCNDGNNLHQPVLMTVIQRGEK